MFKLILDRNHRKDYYNRIVSDKINDKYEKRASKFLNFSNIEKKEIASKISRYNYIETPGNDLNERKFLSCFFISKFYKISANFFGLLFGMNLIFILMVRKQLDHKLPFKTKEDYIIKLKKINLMKKILFFSLIVYEVGFGLLAIKSLKQYRLMIQKTLPELESDLIITNKLDLDKYEKLFSPQ